MIGPEEIDRVCLSISRSRKYRFIHPATIRDVVLQESEGQARRAKLLAGAARKRLHRIVAGYLGAPSRSAAALRLLERRGEGGVARGLCLEVLGRHASTAERIPVLDTFYRRLFEMTGKPASVLDAACAYHPVAFPWMELPKDCDYRAFDLNRETVDFLNGFFESAGVAARAEWRDVLVDPPRGHADVAFLFKTYHCLERRRAGAGWRVVETLPADAVAISFPTRNLSGRRADIAGNYAGDIENACRGRGWSVERLDLEGETFFVVRKS